MVRGANKESSLPKQTQLEEMQNKLKEWLKENYLEQYFDRLVEKGFNSLDSINRLQRMDKDQLQLLNYYELGMKPGI